MRTVEDYILWMLLLSDILPEGWQHLLCILKIICASSFESEIISKPPVKNIKKINFRYKHFVLIFNKINKYFHIRKTVERVLFQGIAIMICTMYDICGPTVSFLFCFPRVMQVRAVNVLYYNALHVIMGSFIICGSLAYNSSCSLKGCSPKD